MVRLFHCIYIISVLKKSTLGWGEGGHGPSGADIGNEIKKSGKILSVSSNFAQGCPWLLDGGAKFGDWLHTFERILAAEKYVYLDRA